MSDEVFMTRVSNNLIEDYDVILDGMESGLMPKENDPNILTIKDVRDKLRGRFDRIHGQFANHKDGPITDETGMAAYSEHMCWVWQIWASQQKLSTEQATQIQISSREQQVRSNLLLLWRERTLHEGLLGQEESQNYQDNQSKKVWIFEADKEQYEPPADDESIKEFEF